MANTERPQTVTNPQKKRLLMWEITSPLADRLFALSNLVLIAGAAAILIGTIGAILMSGVREEFANERISANERATAEARAASDVAKSEVAKATERAAEANRIAEEERLARVKLETQLASRRLTPEQIKNLSTALQNLHLEIKAMKITRLGDQKAHEYATSIAVAVNNSGIYAAMTDIGVMTPPRYGLFVTANLKPAFDSAGITVDGLISGPEGLDRLPEIFVGLKRPPF